MRSRWHATTASPPAVDAVEPDEQVQRRQQRHAHDARSGDHACDQGLRTLAGQGLELRQGLIDKRKQAFDRLVVPLKVFRRVVAGQVGQNFLAPVLDHLTRRHQCRRILHWIAVRTQVQGIAAGRAFDRDFEARQLFREAARRLFVGGAKLKGTQTPRLRHGDQRFRHVGHRRRHQVIGHGLRVEQQARGLGDVLPQAQRGRDGRHRWGPRAILQLLLDPRHQARDVRFGLQQRPHRRVAFAQGLQGLAQRLAAGAALLGGVRDTQHDQIREHALLLCQPDHRQHMLQVSGPGGLALGQLDRLRLGAPPQNRQQHQRRHEARGNDQRLGREAQPAHQRHGGRKNALRLAQRSGCARDAV
ncbi:MAG: hypothetical protein N2055_01005 [Tepidimonas taiwanensis]|nr:hypothetical protein [Tepidimonas taiwanensis]